MTQAYFYPNGQGTSTVSLKSWDFGTYPGEGTTYADIQAAIFAGSPYSGLRDINQDGVVDSADLVAFTAIDTGFTYPLHDKGAMLVGGAVIPQGSASIAVSVRSASATLNTGTPTIQSYLTLNGTTVTAAEVSANANLSQTIARPGGGNWRPEDFTHLYAGVNMRSQSGVLGKGHGICTSLFVQATYGFSSVQGIRYTIQQALSSSSGPNIRTFSKLPASGTSEFPCALIFPKSGDPNTTLHRTTMADIWTVTLLVAPWGDIDTAQDLIDSFIIPTEANSIQAAIEGSTYAPYASYARMVGFRDYGPIAFGGAETYFGVRFDFEIKG
jgi:hypothetical protein